MGTMDRILTVGSLFSGIGGLDLGLERAGLKVVWQCEADPYCRAVLRKHWPEVPCFGDIRELTDPPRVDVVCGGFPCQPVSLAGLRLAQKDARWLWPEFARIVGLVRPRYVVVENVPGLVNKGLSDVLADLTALGYDAGWGIVSAASVGAPHLRERLFVVAYPMCDRLERIFQAGTAQRAVERGSGAWWSVEPDVGRMAHGIPRRMDRLRALGNAVVPQVAEYIGRLIMESGF